MTTHYPEEEPRHTQSSAEVTDQKKIHSVAQWRLARIASDVTLSVRVSSAIPLLLLIVVRCGREDSCTLSLREVEALCNVPHPTLKSWLKKIASAGFISKTPAGRDGVRIVLTEQFQRAVGPCVTDNPATRLVQQASAVKAVFVHAIDRLITDLHVEEVA